MNKINGNFYNQDIISVDQFTKEDLEVIFEYANYYKKGVSRGSVYHELSGKILTALFYEPSSRTFSSFVSAMQRLGGGIIPIHDINISSVAKGETFSDTIKTFASYSDVIVFRHPDKGAAEKAAKISNIPIINAGDGVGEHPTQALLDLFTIKEQLGRMDNLKIALVGDLTHSRTVHSLAKIVSLFSSNELHFVFPSLSPMPSEIESQLKKKKIKINHHQALSEVIKKVDVLYMVRVQKERMEAKLYEKIKDVFKIDNKLANKMKKNALIMAPLPRLGEISEDVDKNPRATYLKYQMRNGMYIRMALLKLILKK